MDSAIRIEDIFINNDNKVFIINCFVMQITSDNEDDGFNVLEDNDYTEIPQSTIRLGGNHPTRQYKAELVELENLPDLAILESQYYSLNLYQNDTLIRNDIKRRFSDFDIFFEILFRNYKGCIFPAFPEKGLVSYVKTKVSLTKDHQYLIQRMHMLERFLTNLLNSGYFTIDKNQEIRKFLSQQQFDLMKKAQKQSSQGMIVTSINRLLSYVKMGRQNKYKSITDQLNQNKKDFERLFILVKQIRSLLQSQQQQYNSFIAEQFKFNRSQEYYNLIRQKQQQQSGNLYKIKQLQFELFCLNEDFIMVLKTIENIEQMKNNQENFRHLQTAQTLFINQYNIFQQRKKKELDKVSKQFTQLLKQIKNTDEAV